jgi:alpha-beta hydrolase superfamily lysophospholipase
MEMKESRIEDIPAIIWGAPSQKIYLYIHGQGGYKEEANGFANIACRHDWQVLSIDLPEHGERKHEKNSFVPWKVVPELLTVMEFVKCHWSHVSLFANSIGAWFSMIGFENEPLEKSLFVSPVLDMKKLIQDMMLWANVSEEQLKRELVIPTSFGQTLSWEYLIYAKAHSVTKWKIPTSILYGSSDNLIERRIVEQFSHDYNCNLTVMENGEHWFHTQMQLEVLHAWLESCLQEG